MIMQNSDFDDDNADTDSVAGPDRTQRPDCFPQETVPRQIPGLMYRCVPSIVTGRHLRHDCPEVTLPSSHLIVRHPGTGSVAARNALATELHFG